MDGTMMKDEVSSDDDAEYEENPEEQGWTDMGAVNEADINGGGPQSLSKSPKTVQFNHQIDVQRKIR